MRFHSSLFLALHLFLAEAYALICNGTPFFSNITVVTRASAPAQYTSLNDWCTPLGLEFANVAYGEFQNVMLTGALCGVSDGIAINAVNGIKWGQCFLTVPFGYRFPTDPGAECAAPVAVVCRPPQTVLQTSITTITDLVRTTITVTSPTVTETDSRTSSRLRTYPCGTATVTDTLSDTVTVTTLTTTITTVQSTIHCPSSRLHICPTHQGEFWLISGAEEEDNARRNQADCACQQDQMRLSWLDRADDIMEAGRVLGDCIGENAKAWINSAPMNTNRTSAPCLVTIEGGTAEVGRCDVRERLPVICSRSRTSCSGPFVRLSGTQDSDRPEDYQFIELANDAEKRETTAKQGTCYSGNIALTYFFLYADIESACSSISMMPMDWVPGVYDADMIAASSECGFFGAAGVRSFNGSVAFCQAAGWDSEVLLNVFVMDPELCSEPGGLWCVRTGVTTALPTSTTGTVTGGTTTATRSERTTTTASSISSVFVPRTLTTTSTVTTVRSLILTPFTTTTVFATTTAVLTTETTTLSITTTVSTRTTTISAK